MKKTILILTLLMVLGTACSPSAEEQAAMTATAKTATAASWTKTPTITLTPTSTSTITPTPTETFTPTPSATASQIPTKTSTPTYTPDPNRYYPIGQCQRTECLFVTQNQPNWLTGVATITGYYQQVEDNEWEVTRICDSLVVITGSDPFVQAMKDLVAYGNSIYKVDELGRPIVHLDFSELSDGERQQLIDSNDQSPAELVVFIPVPQGSSPFDPCYSPVQIIIVQQPMVKDQ